MNLVARQDRVLLGGLAVAVIVLFARPIRHLLDLTQEVERSSGLALTPALLILAAVFLFHQQGKRQESKARAAAAQADANQAEARAVEMERLVTFGQALARALDVEAIPRCRRASTCPSWRAPTKRGCCCGGRTLAGARGTVRENRRETEARPRANRQPRAGSGRPVGVGPDCHRGSPLHPVDGRAIIPIGVLGIPESAAPVARQRVLVMAAALLAISVRNSQLFNDVRENGLRDGLTAVSTARTRST